MTQSPGVPSRAVYRRRRLFALMLAITVVVVLVLIVSRCSSAPNGPAQSSTLSPPSGEAPASTSEAVPQPTAESDACPASNLAVAASLVGDSVRFTQDQVIQFVLSVTNVGDVACTINAGTSQISFVVTSGSQTIWRSSDCPTASDDDEYWDYPLVLQPGETAQSSAVTWPATFSDASSCDTEQASATWGIGAAYWLTGALGDVDAPSDASVQFFLD